MTLSTKSINILISLKSSLLSHIASTSTQNSEPQSVIITLSTPKKGGSTSTTGRMRHAKAPNAYQRWKQRHDCW